MPLGTRCGSLILALGVLAGAAPALAQGDAPATASPPSAWTDPPVRGSAGPEPAGTTTAAKPADAGPAKAEPVPAPAVARTEAPPSRRSIRHATRSSPVRAREAERPAPRSRTARAPAEPARGARTVSRPLRRVETVSVAPPRRSMRERGHGRYYATAEAARLSVGRGTPAYNPGYAMRRRDWAEADGDDGPADVRSVRFAEDRPFARPFARPPAYRVMRLRTVTFPDGRVVQRLYPVEGGPDGD